MDYPMSRYAPTQSSVTDAEVHAAVSDLLRWAERHLKVLNRVEAFLETPLGMVRVSRTWRPDA